ncbi:MAG: sensor histidine kinase, partial [Fidelibacterota bacterium]
AENIPRIKGLYSDFSQSFNNLIKNAIDAMYRSDKKVLTVETGFDGENILVKIGDTGYGISEENIPKLFSPFFTTKPLVGEQKANEPTGSGLGLSVTKQILSRYGAKIDVESKVNVGTTFTVKIPADRRMDS